MTDKLDLFAIKYTQHFSAIRILENELLPLYINVSAELIGKIDSDEIEFQLGVAKLDFWFTNIVQDSLIFSVDNRWANETLLETSANFPLITPYEPTDPMLASIFTCKCNALANEKFSVGFMTIESERSNLTYTYADDVMPDLPSMVVGRSYYDKPWWNRDDSSTFDVLPPEDGDLNDKPECFFSLDFLRERFNKPAEIIRPKFKPTIIPNKK